jgi:hypothetical protein
MNKRQEVKFIFLIFFFMLALPPSIQAAPLAVTVVDTLDFGLLTPGTNGGTVSFPANGSIIGTGNVILLGGEQKGLVTIQARRGKKVQVRVRKSELTGSSRNAKMKFTGSCIGPGGVLGIRKCSFIATGGVDVVSIGAVLKVSPNDRQPGGHYSGITKITAKSK